MENVHLQPGISGEFVLLRPIKKEHCPVSSLITGLMVSVDV